MFALLLRRLALASVLCLLLLTTLGSLDRPELPMLVQARISATAPGDSSAPPFRLTLLPELPAIAYPSPYLVDGSTVVQVVCADESSGSAVYLGSGRYLTAAHVLTNEKTGLEIKCWIFGQHVTVEHIDRTADYAIARAAHYPPFRATISCDRLQEGGAYFATGYAEGNPWPVTTRIRGAGYHESAGENRGTAKINGALVAGMSGGAVADLDGVVHAINDWRDDDGIPDGGVVELADTPLCNKGKK